jgi:hypothetical protein
MKSWNKKNSDSPCCASENYYDGEAKEVSCTKASRLIKAAVAEVM